MDEDRFGVPSSNIRAAEKWLKRTSNKDFKCYVPTRKEVSSLNTEKLAKILIDWMCKSPTEIIPSKNQIVEVRNILLQRDDAQKLSGIITMCNHYINGD
ncbi:hypothetical protein LPB67_09420 [Undibacterium sp. Jales W-56]|uniref:hypothetical protein n=1 Tax=Undibacterium sp. Jales W-56 TaxID=2897325 RepID=UPI0021CFA07E|nr:hypothetical protein [Undibacterium sp. Jales W-56]MCU6433984.1 hypothetical protein [Undibacterium sp. Jales W-56]